MFNIFCIPSVTLIGSWNPPTPKSTPAVALSFLLYLKVPTNSSLHIMHFEIIPVSTEPKPTWGNAAGGIPTE